MLISPCCPFLGGGLPSCDLGIEAFTQHPLSTRAPPRAGHRPLRGGPEERGPPGSARETGGRRLVLRQRHASSALLLPPSAPSAMALLIHMLFPLSSQTSDLVEVPEEAAGPAGGCDPRRRSNSGERGEGAECACHPGGAAQGTACPLPGLHQLWSSVWVSARCSERTSTLTGGLQGLNPSSSSCVLTPHWGLGVPSRPFCEHVISSTDLH